MRSFSFHIHTISSAIANLVIPAIGTVSYELFALRIITPDRFRRFCGDTDFIIANGLWFNAHIGIGIYLFNRNHLKKVSTHKRILYSVFHTFIFNFGSVMFWATSKALLQNDSIIKAIFALTSGGALLMIGKSYLDHVDIVVEESETCDGID
ncbi:hypothetical protein FSP39_007056 [Pinctada imbricata]|uniref:Uncharacterized protein n=1 Tax=Pinctada imbricata TaxID=66713 RepID=A0AA89BWA6_PINIB|nr:hypothetical protein FSP39_007056 [Pinctada imbricata]